MKPYHQLYKIFIIIIIINLISVPAAEKISAGSYSDAFIYGVEYGEALLKNISFDDISRHWAEIPIKRMAAHNLIRGYTPNSFRPNVSIPKEQVIAIIIRAMGKEEAAQKQAELGLDTPISQGGTTVYSYSPWSEGYLQQAYEQGILTEEELITLQWQDPAERQEVAYWLDKALKLPEIYGSEMQQIYSLNDWRDIKKEYLIQIESILKEGIMTGTPKRYFKPKDSMTRAEMAAVMDRSMDLFLPYSGTKKLMGSVVKQTSETELTGTGSIKREIYTVQLLSGETINIAAEDRIINSWQRESNNLIVFKNGKLGDNSLLCAKDDIVFYLDPQNRVTLVEVTGAFNREIVEGEIKNIKLAETGGEIIIETYSGSIYRYRLSPELKPVIDYRKTGLHDLIEGQEITITAVNGTAVAITGFTGIEEGYITPESRIRQGRIRFVDDNSIKIIDAEGIENTYKISSYTDITKSGHKIDADDLSIGEKVMLFFDYLDTDEVSRITVGGFQGKVNAVYKGRLNRADARRGELVLENTSTYYYGNWIDHKSQMNLNLNKDAEIFYDGRAIDISDLEKKYRGCYVYAMILPGYGREEGICIIIKDDDEISDSGRVDSISWISGVIETGNSIIHTNEATMFLNNGNIVDIMDIDEGAKIFYTALSKGDAKKGIIINMIDFYPADYRIFKGNLNEITPQGFIIDSFSEYRENGWSSTRSSRQNREFSLYDDTTIIDTSQETGKKVTLKDFKYARFTHDYYDYFTYIIARDDRAFGIILMPDDGNINEITSIGRITRKDTPIKAVMLDNLIDWNDFREKWNDTLATLEISLRDALIIKDDEIIDFEDLQVGDTLYLIRNNNNGLVAIVQNGMLGGTK
ncbi:MAG TPA: S-layer homology domain-containing protein [Thermoanaerobacterales bacterium]|nr:S-layer homology domain-containing protein [Thermoanaerobacterales bacterium]